MTALLANERLRLAIFDADSIAYVACYNKEGQTKTLAEVYQAVDSILFQNLTTLNATYCIGALTIGRCFRYKVNPQYKANRKDMEPMPFLKEAKKYMVEVWGFISHPDLEADDIVHICRKYFEKDWEVVVVSTDKDVLNLEGTNYNPKQDKFYFNNLEEADYALFKQVLTGDSVDNIKGVYKIGPKKADKILGNPYNILWHRTLQAYIDNSPNFDVALDNFYMNYKCLKILDAYEGFEVEKIVPILASDIITFNDEKEDEERAQSEF